MPIPTIDALPTPPSRSSSPATFSDDADVFLGAFPGLRVQANAMAAAMDTTAANADADAAAAAASAAAAANSAGAAAGSATSAQAAMSAAINATAYVAESATSLSFGLGSKAFTVPAGKNLAVNDAVLVKRRGDANAQMSGTVASYSGTLLTVTVTAANASGGPYADWVIALAAFTVDRIALQAQAIAFAAAL